MLWCVPSQASNLDPGRSDFNRLETRKDREGHERRAKHIYYTCGFHIDKTDGRITKGHIIHTLSLGGHNVQCGVCCAARPTMVEPGLHSPRDPWCMLAAISSARHHTDSRTRAAIEHPRMAPRGARVEPPLVKRSVKIKLLTVLPFLHLVDEPINQ